MLSAKDGPKIIFDQIYVCLLLALLRWKYSTAQDIASYHLICEFLTFSSTNCIINSFPLNKTSKHVHFTIMAVGVPTHFITGKVSKYSDYLRRETGFKTCLAGILTVTLNNRRQSEQRGDTHTVFQSENQNKSGPVSKGPGSHEPRVISASKGSEVLLWTWKRSNIDSIYVTRFMAIYYKVTIVHSSN